MSPSVSNNFEETVRMIANGTSTEPTPPSDPIVDALNQLENELEDVTSGFVQSLSKTITRGAALFSIRPTSESDDGFFSVRDGQQRKDDLRGVNLGKVDTKKESVGTISLKGAQADEEINVKQKVPGMIGTMPLSPPPVETPKGDAAFDPSKVIIGKDKVQIEQELKDVPLESTRHDEL